MRPIVQFFDGQMINIFTHELTTAPVRRLLSTAGAHLPQLRLVTYQTAFRDLSFPAGSLIFADFEFLNAVEMEAAANMAIAALKANPETKVLNDPRFVCERFQLLRRLKRLGLTPTEVVRLDSEEKPTRYPVFIRMEDGCWGPETDLLPDETAFNAAVSNLRATGKPIKRRIAISFEGEKDAEGFYRKYGAIRIGDHIIPQHVFRSQNWIVKSRHNDYDQEFVQEENDYVDNNPHRDVIKTIFDAGGLQFGRLDYGFKDGAIVAFEINPSPTFPRFTDGNPDRQSRRTVILERIKQAFTEIDGKDAGNRVIRFPPPLYHELTQMDRWSSYKRFRWRRALRKYLAIKRASA